MSLLGSTEQIDAEKLYRFAKSLQSDQGKAGNSSFPDAYRLSLIEQAKLAARQLESPPAELVFDTEDVETH